MPFGATYKVAAGVPGAAPGTAARNMLISRKDFIATPSLGTSLVGRSLFPRHSRFYSQSRLRHHGQLVQVFGPVDIEQHTRIINIDGNAADVVGVKDVPQTRRPGH